MNIQKEVQKLLDRNANDIIKNLPDSFDSHDFIQKLIEVDERGYVETLSTFIRSQNGIFRSFHSQIGIYLSSEKDRLNIESRGKVSSKNIKGNPCDNENWIKK